jgi:hypothetical protein
LQADGLAEKTNMRDWMRTLDAVLGEQPAHGLPPV